MIEGTPVKVSVRKRTSPAKRPCAELRQINSGGDAEGHADDAGHRQQNQRAENGIADAAAFADRLRRVDQKLEADRAQAPIGDVAENQREHDDGEEGAGGGQRRHHGVRRVAFRVHGSR
jgi:hypothetical protein